MNYIKQIKEAKSIEELHQIKAKLIGKNGEITNEIKNLSNLTIEEKRTKGKELNVAKNQIDQIIKEQELLIKSEHQKKLDCSYLPNVKIGKKHIITHSIELLNKIFADLGFEEIIGPDIEDAYYNFDALNMPENHPARDNNDTFYMEDNELLRTQVTAVQIRLLEKIKNEKKEIRAYSIGRVYRNDTHDATHSCMFQQIEGIILEKNITMQHLKGLLEHILERFFEKKIKTVFRPSFFPFTEPSCEVYAYTKIENNKLIVTDTGDALEIGGCGMIHPSILKTFNKENEQAFAFGMGLERWIMLKYGINNLNILYNNQMPYLKLYD